MFAALDPNDTAVGSSVTFHIFHVCKGSRTYTSEYSMFDRYDLHVSVVRIK